MPIFPLKQGSETAKVRRRNVHHAAGFQQTKNLRERRPWVGKMFSHFDQHTGIKVLLRKPGFLKIAHIHDPQAPAIPSIVGGKTRTLDAMRVPAALTGKRHEMPHGASDVEQTARLEVSAEVVRNLRVEIIDAGPQNSVLFDSGKIRTLEVAVALHVEITRVHISQLAAGALHHTVPPLG